MDRRTIGRCKNRCNCGSRVCDRVRKWRVHRRIDEKASTLDEAEEKSLSWIGNHMSNVEARSYKTCVLPAVRSSFPKGFFQSEYDARPLLPVRLTKLEWLDGDFILTLESTERTPDKQRKSRRPSSSLFRRRLPDFPDGAGVSILWIKSKI